MSRWQVLLRPLDSPIRALITIFVAWKSLLLAVAICSPGAGYDTSTYLYHQTQSSPENFLPAVLSVVSGKLTRWDAIYFTKVANRGYLYEQEWAFGWGMTRLIEYFAKDLRKLGFEHDFVEGFVGITIAHLSHGASVLTLYRLGQAVFPADSGRKASFIASCLHIFSPAGLFLSAPYSESTFSLLAFSGCLCFVQSFHLNGSLKDLSIVASGILFGLSTAVRSNGLLYGIIFLEEAFRVLYSLRDGLSVGNVRHLVATGAGGISIAFGFLLPQYIAYQDLCCTPSAVWCSNSFPSVFTYVQDHYWDVGFLRYWKISNIPLFLLAIPMLSILSISALWTFETPTSGATTQIQQRLLRSLAAPQILLAGMALTSYHVQIITRLASGYPLWYFFLAAELMKAKSSSAPKSFVALSFGSDYRVGTSIVKYMVIYAVVQGGLFASFLPPA